MIKKSFLVLLAASSLFFTGCSDTKDAKSKDKDKKEVTKDDDDVKPKEDDDESSSDIKKAALAYCECFNDAMGDMSSTLKKIIVKASKTSDPQTTMQNEMMNIDDEEEKMKIATEAQKLSDMGDVETCTKKVDKKYGVKEDDTKAQKQILQVLDEESDCDVVAALMKIGLKAKGQKTMSEE